MILGSTVGICNSQIPWSQRKLRSITGRRSLNLIPGIIGQTRSIAAPPTEEKPETCPSQVGAYISEAMGTIHLGQSCWVEWAFIRNMVWVAVKGDHRK